jgi:RNA polymerase sigma-70 factor, ECF subfamily
MHSETKNRGGKVETTHLLCAASPDSACFTCMVQPHRDSLSRLVHARVRNASDAEDIVQETLYKAFSRFSSFRHEASFKTWLFAIALNEICQHYRKKRTMDTRILEQGAVEHLEFADPRGSVLADYARSEEARLVRLAISRLPAHYEAVVRLQDLEELSERETAKLLDLTVNTVKTRHHRARRQLRQRLEALRNAFHPLTPARQSAPAPCMACGD